jgi:hypothetical protein
VLEKINKNTKNNLNSDLDNSVFSDGGTDENSDTNYNIFNNDDFNRFSDNFNIIDNKYDVDSEKMEMIV